MSDNIERKGLDYYKGLIDESLNETDETDLTDDNYMGDEDAEYEEEEPRYIDEWQILYKDINDDDEYFEDDESGAYERFDEIDKSKVSQFIKKVYKIVGNRIEEDWVDVLYQNIDEPEESVDESLEDGKLDREYAKEVSKKLKEALKKYYPKVKVSMTPGTKYPYIDVLVGHWGDEEKTSLEHRKLALETIYGKDFKTNDNYCAGNIDEHRMAMKPHQWEEFIKALEPETVNESYTVYELDDVIDFVKDWRENYFKDVTSEVLTDAPDMNGIVPIDVVVDVDTLLFTEEQYKQWEDIVTHYCVEKDKYKVYFWCDNSGYDYWTGQGDSNYLNLTVGLKETELKQEDLDAIKSDLSTAMDRYLDKLEEITTINVQESLAELNNSINEALK